MDTEDGGKIYQTREWPHYDDSSWEVGEASLHIYMYQEHFCPCNRKSAVNDAGGDVDEECEGERFVVKAITAPDHLPGVVLYSETDSAEMLWEKCKGALEGLVEGRG